MSEKPRLDSASPPQEEMQMRDRRFSSSLTRRLKNSAAARRRRAAMDPDQRAFERYKNRERMRVKRSLARRGNVDMQFRTNMEPEKRAVRDPEFRSNVPKQKKKPFASQNEKDDRVDYLRYGRLSHVVRKLHDLERQNHRILADPNVSNSRKLAVFGARALQQRQLVNQLRVGKPKNTAAPLGMSQLSQASPPPVNRRFTKAKRRSSLPPPFPKKEEETVYETGDESEDETEDESDYETDSGDERWW